MVDAAADGGHKAPPARNLGVFPGAKRDMSFVTAHSKHDSWIVGVGGRRGYTAIYDPSTQALLSGPDLRCPKHEPILISHGGKVYALSRHPRVGRDATRDFEMWFESLGLNDGETHATMTTMAAGVAPSGQPCRRRPSSLAPCDRRNSAARRTSPSHPTPPSAPTS
uniref:Uncharacterized protein n=1 Tax=Triticum urartu TaxID=4572 RepID=A0A8R7P2T9_TRIUA